MFDGYYNDPILGVYHFAREGFNAQAGEDLQAFVDAGLNCVWLFFDSFYDQDDSAGLRAFLDEAERRGIGIVPALGQFLQLKDHPEVKIVNADGTTSDNPRYWNMGCFRQPTVRRLAAERATRFFRELGDHPALYRIEGKPLMNFVHEAYYRNSVPEFGGPPMQPSCYCEHCLAAWRDYLAARDLDPDTPAPRENSDPHIWKHWLDCHAEAIPAFLAELIATTREVTGVWATHECNDFYPASWQSVYTGNDWWRMGAVLDIGHEDMYPLEFDTRYQCYVFDYAKDMMRSALNFQGMITANGQAFDSWLGYKIPDNSHSEQVYSALAHGAEGLVWWTSLRNEGDRYGHIRATTQANADYLQGLQAVEGFTLARAKVALLYSWTTMGQELADNHTYDTLLLYMLLVQAGYPVDILSEEQVSGGMLDARGYDALFVLGGAAIPAGVRAQIDGFVVKGGLIVTDYAPTLNAELTPLFTEWRGEINGKRPRIYTLPDGTPIPVQLAAASLTPPQNAEVLAQYEDGTPAICRIKHGEGTIILAGSYLGWDYSNYPGYYDLAAMFPFHIRQDAALRDYLAALLNEAGITPAARSSHPDVEVGIWHSPQDDGHVAFVVNHLQDESATTITLPVEGTGWRAQRLDGAAVALTESPGEVAFDLALPPMQGYGIRLTRG